MSRRNGCSCAASGTAARRYGLAIRGTGRSTVPAASPWALGCIGPRRGCVEAERRRVEACRGAQAAPAQDMQRTGSATLIPLGDPGLRWWVARCRPAAGGGSPSSFSFPAMHAWYHRFLHPLAPRLAARRPSPSACCPLHCLSLPLPRRTLSPPPPPPSPCKQIPTTPTPLRSFPTLPPVNKHPPDKHFISSIHTEPHTTAPARLAPTGLLFASSSPAPPSTPDRLDCSTPQRLRHSHRRIRRHSARAQGTRSHYGSVPGHLGHLGLEQDTHDQGRGQDPARAPARAHPTDLDLGIQCPTCAGSKLRSSSVAPPGPQPQPRAIRPSAIPP